jgi:hypothetical protein
LFSEEAGLGFLVGVGALLLGVELSAESSGEDERLGAMTILRLGGSDAQYVLRAREVDG